MSINTGNLGYYAKVWTIRVASELGFKDSPTFLCVCYRPHTLRKSVKVSKTQPQRGGMFIERQASSTSLAPAGRNVDTKNCPNFSQI